MLNRTGRPPVLPFSLILWQNQKPKTWDTRGIKKYMIVFGSISSLFDVCCFLVLWHVMGYDSPEKASSFQTGWFAFGIISQTLIIHLMRTNKVPFENSFSSRQLLLSTFLVTGAVLALCFTPLAELFSLSCLPWVYMLWILALLALYSATIAVYKAVTVEKYGALL